MSFKVVVLLACVTVASAGYAHHYDHYDHHSPAHYKFNYGVADPHTGDVKSQQETRVGDVVKGSYSLNEADGTKRIVHYTAGHDGFNAHVERVGHAAHSIHPVGLAGRGYWGHAGHGHWGNAVGYGSSYGGYGLGYGAGLGYGNGYYGGYRGYWGY